MCFPLNKFKKLNGKCWLCVEQKDIDKSINEWLRKKEQELYKNKKGKLKMNEAKSQETLVKEGLEWINEQTKDMTQEESDAFRLEVDKIINLSILERISRGE